MTSSPSTPVLPRMYNNSQQQQLTPSPIPRSPRSPDMLQVKYKDYKSAIDAVLQLEAELSEFQASSYDLEKELEKELTDLELQNKELNDKVDELERQLKLIKENHAKKEEEYADSRNDMLKQIESLRAELSGKLARLIDVEIANDNLEQNERNLKTNQGELKNEYNEALERNILLETELNDLKTALFQEQLKNQNLENELVDLKLSHSKAYPSSRSSSQTMPKSNSLLQLHSIRSQSKGMGSKLDDIKTTLQSSKNNSIFHFNKKSKGNTTTKLSSTHIIAHTPGSTSSKLSTSNPTFNFHSHNNSSQGQDYSTHDAISIEKNQNATVKKKAIPSSPNSFKLSSLVNSNRKRLSKLEKIKGSPNKDHDIPDEKENTQSRGKLSFGGFL